MLYEKLLPPHYIVNGKIYFNKIDAIIDAGKTNAEVKWEFYTSVFQSLDWKTEPVAPLTELYIKRAKQIRETYDYVVVLCSGGADSTNVAKTFLENGIKIDEIIAAAPTSGIKNYNFNNTDTSHINTMSETIYAQLPFINEISQKYTGVKITLHDYFQDIIEYYDTDEWLYRCDDWIHPSSAARYRYERCTHLRDIADSGKKIAFVYGIDKPYLAVSESDRIYSVFSDLAVNVQRPPFDRIYPNVDNVLFYWDPACSDMLVKQAHVLMRWLSRPENRIAKSYLHYVDLARKETHEQSRYRNSRFQREIVPCIYEGTHRSVFQAEKPSKSFLGEHDAWFYQLHNKTRTFEMLVSDTKNFFNTINGRYLNSSRTGFLIYSNHYEIGNLSDFTLNKYEISLG